MDDQLAPLFISIRDQLLRLNMQVAEVRAQLLKKDRKGERSEGSGPRNAKKRRQPAK